MDEEHARQLLGLGAGRLTAAAIREARNAALKAHHPDLAGTDEGASRRANYWSSQINAAFDVLNATLSGGQAAPRQADPAKQSFAAAARRAAERAERERVADEEQAARRRAAEEQAARDRAAKDRAAQERAAAAERAAPRAAAPEAKAGGEAATTGAPTLGRARRRARTVGLVAAVVVVATTVVAAMASAQRLSASNPSPSPSPAVAAASGTPTPIATPSPAPTERPAKLSFDYWLASYTSSVLPCYSGGACNLEADVMYSDGTKAQLSAELDRLATLFRDQTDIQLSGTPLCREEHASLYALLSSMSAEADLINALKPDETAPAAWRPSQAVRFEPCSTLVKDFAARSGELDGLLAAARVKLVKAERDLKTKSWADLRNVALELGEIGTGIGLRAARDFQDGEGDAWKPLRALGWDLVRVSGDLGVPRIAQAKSTADLIAASITSIDHAPISRP